MRILIFFISLLFYSISLFSQSPSFKKYTVEDGLPGNEVYHAIQYKKGYVWFATDNGVSRFDGCKFENFNLQEGLPDNTITSLYEDYKGRIWFVSHSCQLSYFYNDSIYRYKYNEILLEKFYDRNEIYKLSIYVDINNTLWIGTVNHGIFSVTVNGEIQSFKQDNIISLLLKGDRVVIGRFYKSPSSNTRIKSTDGAIDFIINEYMGRNMAWMYSIKSKRNNNLLFGYRNTIYIFNNKEEIKKHIENTIIWLSEVDDKIWVGTYKGGVFSLSNNAKDNTKEHYLEEKSVTSVLFDNEKGYWFTTLNGVYYTPSLNCKSYTEVNGLSNNNVNCVEKGDSSDIWIGTSDNYLNLLNQKGIKKIKTNENKNVVTTYTLKYDKQNKKLYYGGTNNFGWFHNDKQKKLII